MWSYFFHEGNSVILDVCKGSLYRILPADLVTFLQCLLWLPNLPMIMRRFWYAVDIYVWAVSGRLNAWGTFTSVRLAWLVPGLRSVAGCSELGLVFVWGGTLWRGVLSLFFVSFAVMGAYLPYISQFPEILCLKTFRSLWDHLHIPCL